MWMGPIQQQVSLHTPIIKKITFNSEAFFFICNSICGLENYFKNKFHTVAQYSFQISNSNSQSTLANLLSLNEKLSPSHLYLQLDTS